MNNISDIIMAVKASKKQTSASMRRTVNNHFSTMFIKYEEPMNALLTAYMSGENVVLWGPGGYGKSQMTTEFFKALGHDPFVMSLGQGSTIEALFGGINMKGLLDEGKMEFMPERSFMNHEFVVFEEGFDAPPFVLEQLKDTLSSGEYRNGDLRFKIKTKMVVICTNRSREEYAEDASIQALTERFVIDCHVRWDNHSLETYTQLLDIVLQQDSTLAAEILYEAAGGGVVSPRTFVKAAKVYNLCGVDGLATIAGFNKESLRELKKREDLKKREHKARVQWGRIYKTVKSLPNIDIENSSKEELIEMVALAGKVEERIMSFEASDSIEERRQETAAKWRTFERICKEKLFENVIISQKWDTRYLK